MTKNALHNDPVLAEMLSLWSEYFDFNNSGLHNVSDVNVQLFYLPKTTRQSPNETEIFEWVLNIQWQDRQAETNNAPQIHVKHSKIFFNRAARTENRYTLDDAMFFITRLSTSYIKNQHPLHELGELGLNFNFENVISTLRMKSYRWQNTVAPFLLSQVEKKLLSVAVGAKGTHQLTQAL